MNLCYQLKCWLSWRYNKLFIFIIASMEFYPLTYNQAHEGNVLIKHITQIFRLYALASR